MNAPKKRSPFAIVRRLIVLVRPMLPVMLAAIAMGVAGYFCATFITIFGGFGLLAAGLESPISSVSTIFACILVFALLRGVLRYAEQASNHSIAFKLLALIRNRVFGALRRLTPAKLEGRDRGDLISLITADIEQLEVFYAHTISPVCIAVVCVGGMTCFTARYHLLPALVLYFAAFTAAGFWMLAGACLIFGLSLGILLSLSAMQMGWRGLLFLACALLPQWLFYGMAGSRIADLVKRKREQAALCPAGPARDSRWKIVKDFLGTAGAVCCGIGSEMLLNPLLLRLFLKFS